MEKLSYKITNTNSMQIGIVGASEISEEYIKIIKSFKHKVLKIVTKTKSKKNIKFCQKYKIKYHYTDFQNAINSEPRVDAWIICSSWDSLAKNFKLAIKSNIFFLIEKSILLTVKELVKINNTLSVKQKKMISIGYNRSHYDYIPTLLKEMKRNKPQCIIANLPDNYSSVIKKKGNKIQRHLVKYITSHWIALILKILKINKIKIELKKIKKYSENNILKTKTYIFDLKQGTKTLPLIINIIPNNPSNTEISFYCKSKNFKISPAEKLDIFYDIKIYRNKKKQNIYLPQKKSYLVNDYFKPGFKKQYNDFINCCVLRKKNSNLLTTIDDLIEIYKICELLN